MQNRLAVERLLHDHLGAVPFDLLDIFRLALVVLLELLVLLLDRVALRFVHATGSLCCTGVEQRRFFGG